MPAFTAIPEPDQSHAVTLNAPNGNSVPGEQWEKFYDDETVRNVTTSTLTPVLPDPAKASGAAVIVAPGGGFMYLSMKQEGNKVARWLADHGIAAFVLKYRMRETPRDPTAFQTELNAMLTRVAGGRREGERRELAEIPVNSLEDAKAAVGDSLTVTGPPISLQALSPRRSSWKALKICRF